MNKTTWSAAFLGLRPAERLKQIDLLTVQIAELAHDAALRADSSTIHQMLEVNHMLLTHRHRLALADEPASIEIVATAQSLVTGLQPIYDLRQLYRTIH